MDKIDKVSEFQNEIYKKFKRYKLNKKKPTFNQICFPKSFTYQLPQLFVSNFINPNTNHKGLLIYHKIGAGKTCAAIQIAEQWKNKRNIIIVTPASLIGNFYKELRSECTGNIYVTNDERNRIRSLDVESKEYNNLVIEINKRINKYYNIYSYNKFVDLIKSRKIKFDNSLLIIDEVQNVVSEHGTYYRVILSAINNAPTNLRVVIMSATPIFDKPMELGLTLNLLRPKELFPIGKKFNDIYIDYEIHNNKPKYNIKNVDDLRNKLNGLISYYQGAPSYVFPERIQKIVKCPMSRYQYDSYKIVQEREGPINKLDLLKLPNNFFIGSRITSNIAYPNKLVNQPGLNALTKNMMDIDNLEKYSIKICQILKRIQKSSGPIFIYSNFKEYGGILPLIKIIEHHGYLNFLTHGSGRLRYAIWSGDESLSDREMLKTVFNSKTNKNGSKIKIILGSPAIKEGVSLLRVKQVHILEPYWNMSRIKQVIGRAIRFCSHKDVEPDKRKVKVFIYIATIPSDLALKEKTLRLNKYERLTTVDEHIYNMAIAKQKLNNQFEEVIKKSAIDYALFQDV
jgi:superfamily II DNA or RNA helicase